MLPYFTPKEIAEARNQADSEVVIKYDEAINGNLETIRELVDITNNGHYKTGTPRSYMNRCASTFDIKSYAGSMWFNPRGWKGSEYIINASHPHARLANWLGRIDDIPSGANVVLLVNANNAKLYPEGILMLHAITKNLICVYDGEDSADIEELAPKKYRDNTVRYTGEFPLDIATPYIREKFMDVMNTYAWRNAFVAQYSSKIKSVKNANAFANAIMLGYETIEIKTGAKSGGSLKGDAKKALEGVQLDFSEDTKVGKQLKKVEHLENICKIWNAVSRKHLFQINIGEHDLKDKMPRIEDTFKTLARAFDVYPMIDSYYKGKPIEDILADI